ncbi:MAG: addiction module antidote protein, HigA family [Micavibrio sp.]|nr:MAG: addiction module antidote protein, HigA family [Micavibrio sp.]
MAMKKPPHPGRQIRTALEAAGMNITDGAAHLGVTRNTLSRVVNGLAGISPEMAIRLAKAFGGTPDIWVRMQAGYDLAQAMAHQDKIKVTPLKYAQTGKEIRVD